MTTWVSGKLDHWTALMLTALTFCLNLKLGQDPEDRLVCLLGDDTDFPLLI